MKILVTEEQRSELVTNHFLRILGVSWDKVFDNLLIEDDGESGYVKWIDPSIDDEEENFPFSKNYWGYFWTHNCEYYNKLKVRQRYLSLSDEEFKNLLLIYLNGKYGMLFPNRLIKNIDNSCDSDYE